MAKGFPFNAGLVGVITGRAACKGLFKRTIQHSTLYDRHCIALLGKLFKRTIHGLYNHSISMTKQRIVG